MQVKGNTDGIQTTILERLQNLYDHQIPREEIIDSVLAGELASLTASIKKEIAVYADRRGRIVHVAVGTDYTVPLEEVPGRRSPHGLSGIRCIHTHPGESGELSPVDISALEIMRFDCMAALGVFLAGGDVGTVGVGFLDLEGGEPKAKITTYPSLAEAAEINFIREVREIEKNIEKMNKVADEFGPERAFLIGIQSQKIMLTDEDPLEELAQLAETAGLIVIGKEIQKKIKPDYATYFGKGKVEDLQLIVQTNHIDVVLVDDELSPAQQRNLEVLLNTKVIDRTMLILDIFAQRAWSNEGKLQVELAQLKYLLPRLTGQGTALSRLGGGIGTRGPGETKLEVDRRRIRKRITDLEDRLENVKKTRQLHRKRWGHMELPQIALVGYTNAGKSSLMNSMTGADVMVENMLFATLDPTTRMVELPDGGRILVTDTVGFIRKLPHHLVASFSATLEETVGADLLLHVMDGTRENIDDQAAAVNHVLKELGALDRPVINVINKIDLIESDGAISRLLQKYDNSVAVSAKKNIGIKELLTKIQEILPRKMTLIKVLIPYAQGALVTEIHDKGRVVREEHEAGGTLLEAYVDVKLKGILERNAQVDFLTN